MRRRLSRCSSSVTEAGMSSEVLLREPGLKTASTVAVERTPYSNSAGFAPLSPKSRCTGGIRPVSRAASHSRAWHWVIFFMKTCTFTRLTYTRCFTSTVWGASYILFWRVIWLDSVTRVRLKNQNSVGCVLEMVVGCRWLVVRLGSARFNSSF